MKRRAKHVGGGRGLSLLLSAHTHSSKFGYILQEIAAPNLILYPGRRGRRQVAVSLLSLALLGALG